MDFIQGEMGGKSEPATYIKVDDSLHVKVSKCSLWAGDQDQAADVEPVTEK